MNKDQTQGGSSSVGIRFDTHQFDTEFLERHWFKVVIQEVPRGRYWECQGCWTTDIQKAASFATCTAALAQATHLNLSNAQLVLTRESKAYGVIPLESELGTHQVVNGMQMALPARRAFGG